MNGRMPADVSEDRPSAARVYDYLLGGYHNFEVDRMVARRFIEIFPDAPLFMRANRAFMIRVVRFLREQGIEQFLDLGSGIPTVGNVHELVQEVNPSARVVYVDNEPVAVRHSETILQNTLNATIVQADLRQPEVILNRPEVGRLLDLDKPTAVLLVSVLLFVLDDEEAYGVVRSFREALAPGSYVAISHATEDGAPREQIEQAKKLYASTHNPVTLRARK